MPREAGAAGVLPLFEPLVNILDEDDRGVDHRPDGHGDSTERHDVGRESLVDHRDESQHDAHRDRQDRDQRAPYVQKKDEDHEGDDRHLLDERAAERVDRGLDQLGAVVRDQNLDTLRKSGLELGQPCLHGADHPQRVLAVAHDDDSADHLPFAVELDQAATHVRADLHGRDVFQVDRGTRIAHPQRDAAQVFDVTHVAAAADRVLVSRELDGAATRVFVRLPHRSDHILDRDLEGQQAVGVDLNLVLAYEAADRGDLGNAGNALERVTHVPVLEAPEIRQVECPRAIHKRILEDPTDTGCIRAQRGRHTGG